MGNTDLTKLFERAAAVVSRLRPETQDDLARLMLALAEDAPIPLGPDEAAAISEAEIARGERVPPQAIQAFWHFRSNEKTGM